MRAPQEILDVWHIFDDKPMDTLMKLWWYKQNNGGSQRPVSLIKEHFAQYGVAGNCVDLSLWLIEEFRMAGIEAFGITDDVDAKRAHIAVIAVDSDGFRYLCDLGDQWIQPIAIDESVVKEEDFVDGYFPAAKVKVSTEEYKTTISERVQRAFRKTPLVEIRLPIEGEIAHWEFDNWTSFLSTSQKLHVEESNLNLEQWVERINMRTGMKKEFLQEALNYYKNIDA
ncbi:MAG: hypothetical protein R3267_00605 [Paenisporosarcina sp.]|nr:hypothetical protein [Paenisporosarcina sp.]